MQRSNAIIMQGFNMLNSASSSTGPLMKKKPYKIRLPGFVKEGEVGLGDVVKKTTYAIGLRPCGGCQKRAAVLNSWIMFTS